MCGIVGFLGAKGRTPDLTKIKLLACGNDSRGGDGIGIWFNNYEDMIAKTTKYDNFSKYFQSLKFRTTSTTATSCILHTRKASKGWKTEENLHPYQLTKDFIFCHNGTIYNIDDLLKKYPLDIDSKKHTDSFILANIIYTYGYEVLTKYQGAATLVWTENRGKTLKIFKGASLNRQNQIEEERPLFSLITKEGIYFNSRKEELEIIKNEEDGEIENIGCNKIYEFKYKRLISAVLINRETCKNYEEFFTNYHCYPPAKSTHQTSLFPKSNCQYDYFDKKMKIRVRNGEFSTRKNKPLHGVYRVDTNGLTLMQHINELKLVDNKKYILFHRGIWCDTDRMQLYHPFKNKSIKEILEVQVGSNAKDVFTKIPILVGSDTYWFNSMRIVDPKRDHKTYKIDFLNTYFCLKSDNTAFISPMNDTLIKALDNSFEEDDINIFDNPPDNPEDLKKFIIKKTCKLQSISETIIVSLLALPNVSKITEENLYELFNYDPEGQFLTHIDISTFDLLSVIDRKYFKYLPQEFSLIKVKDFKAYLGIIDQKEVGGLSNYFYEEMCIYVFDYLETKNKSKSTEKESKLPAMLHSAETYDYMEDPTHPFYSYEYD